jgi:hypothetical protein
VLANTSPAPSDQVANAIARTVLGLPVQTAPAPKDLAMPSDERARYIGNYDITRPDGSKRRIQIADESAGLMLTQEGRNAKMMSQGGNVFYVAGQGRIVFDVTGGRATGFVVGAGGVRPLEAVRAP